MLYVLFCEDKPASLELRLSVRSEHLAYASAQPVKFAGPMLAEDEQTMIGSMLVVEADNLEAARKIAENDPYNKAGLFARVTVRAFRQAIPAAQ